MRHIYTSFVFFICLLLFSPVLAQDNFQHKKDSILKIISTLTGKAKLDAYENLGKQLFYQESDVADILPIFEAWEKEAQKQGDVKLQRRVMYLSLGILINRHHYDLFLKQVDRALSFAEQHDLYDEHYYAVQNSRLSALYELGRLNESLQGAKSLYNISKENNRPVGQTTALFRMAEIYSNLRRFTEAEKCYKECLDILNKELSTASTSIDCYFGLVELLLIQKQNKEVFDTLNKWETLLQKIDKEEGTPDNHHWKQFYFMTAFVYTQIEDFHKASDYLQKADSIPSTYNGIENPSFRSLVRALVLESQKQYDQALILIDECIKDKNMMVAASAMSDKLRILCKMKRSEEVYPLFLKIQEVRDSVQDMRFGLQLDDLRTQYEVDKITTEKEKIHSYMYFTLAVCILLIITLGIWIYYNRKIAKKNKTLVDKIKELQTQHEKAEAELLNQMTLETEDTDNDLYPESRKNQLCVAIRNALLKEKAYRDPLITRDSMVERLITNKELFTDAFQHCFNVSFSEYINLLRLKDVIILLEESDLSIEQISEKVGFGTVRTFQRQFQSKYNMSPKEYRKAITK